jgi:hypothetical protein
MDQNNINLKYFAKADVIQCLGAQLKKHRLKKKSSHVGIINSWAETKVDHAMPRNERDYALFLHVLGDDYA